MAATDKSEQDGCGNVLTMLSELRLQPSCCNVFKLAGKPFIVTDTATQPQSNSFAITMRSNVSCKLALVPSVK